MIKRIALAALAAIVVFVAGVLLLNASFRGTQLTGQPTLIAHRGVHQTFDLEGVDNDTCTASRIRPPTGPEIENTIASMAAAFAAGAGVVELDVHPTADGAFAVFHDWTLDCRTDGTGVTREQSLAYLKSLDVGYGYTADDGATYPLRGTAVGAMPSLQEVFAAFPDNQFLVHFKSNEAREGDMLADLIAGEPAWRDNVWAVYGGGPPTGRAMERVDGLRGFPLAAVKECLIPYVRFGWAGAVPDACHDTVVPVPLNVGRWLWGWPALFVQRMREAGSEVLIVGDYAPKRAMGGVDTVEDAARVPDGFDGYVWTNDIRAIAPLFGAGTSPTRTGTAGR